jgi:hypothetical protein
MSTAMNRRSYRGILEFHYFGTSRRVALFEGNRRPQYKGLWAMQLTCDFDSITVQL